MRPAHSPHPRRRPALGAAAVALAAALALAACSSSGDSTDTAATRADGSGLRPCTQTVSSIDELQDTVASADDGSVVCLADGRYGKAMLDRDGSGHVTIRAEQPGKATIKGAQLDGAGLTLERFVVSDAIDVMPLSTGMTVAHNRITGGYFGVDAGPTDEEPVTDVTIRGNQFVGPFGEDAIRANRYHDSDDPDANGLLIEGNEFTNVRENGAHSDCLQTVWVGDHLVFRENYLHDNHCQGFFVKDQRAPIDSVVAEDNLIVRNTAPCTGVPDCGYSLDFYVFGPLKRFRAAHNTIWKGTFGLARGIGDDGWGSTTVVDSVLYKVDSAEPQPFVNARAQNNINCDPVHNSYPLNGFTRDCAPKFRDPAHDDYRLPSGQGVTWAPAQRRYGP